LSKSAFTVLFTKLEDGPAVVLRDDSDPSSVRWNVFVSCDKRRMSCWRDEFKSNIWFNATEFNNNWCVTSKLGGEFIIGDITAEIGNEVCVISWGVCCWRPKYVYIITRNLNYRLNWMLVLKQNLRNLPMLRITK
jgi:hypothetical protein